MTSDLLQQAEAARGEPFPWLPERYPLPPDVLAVFKLYMAHTEPLRQEAVGLEAWCKAVFDEFNAKKARLDELAKSLEQEQMSFWRFFAGRFPELKGKPVHMHLEDGTYQLTEPRDVRTP